MNPNRMVLETIRALRDSDARKLAAQRAQSRAAQPRRRDHRKLVTR
jgi:hypothetical protein